MYNTSLLTLLLSLTICTVSALPRHGRHIHGRSFSIPAVRSDHHAKASNNTDRSNNELNSKLSDGSRSVLSRRQDGPVGAYQGNVDLQFLSPVTIGLKTGFQVLNLLLDTGSSDFWVFSSRQPGDQLAGHSYYDPTKSRTFHDEEDNFDVEYNDDEVTGDIGYDDVNIGETTVLEQFFGLADDVSDASRFAGDGIVGLNLGSEISIGASTFFDNARPSLSEGVFTAWLPRSGVGAFEFGEIDDTKYSGDISYAYISEESGEWEFESAAYKVNGNPVEDPGRLGIADTGTSTLLLNSNTAYIYWQFVDGWIYDTTLKAYTYPCDVALPSFSFLVGPDTYATIPGEDLTDLPLSSDPTRCRGLLQSSPDLVNVYGIPFFYNYFAVFDVSNKKFGIADIVSG